MLSIEEDISAFAATPFHFLLPPAAAGVRIAPFISFSVITMPPLRLQRVTPHFLSSSMRDFHALSSARGALLFSLRHFQALAKRARYFLSAEVVRQQVMARYTTIDFDMPRCHFRFTMFSLPPFTLTDAFHIFLLHAFPSFLCAAIHAVTSDDGEDEMSFTALHIFRADADRHYA